MMQAGLCQLRRDEVQKGQSTPRKAFPHLFPINKGCSSRDGGGDGTVASGGKLVIAGKGDRGP